ncbi:MAG TPA: 2-oxo-4-hydroxy-4-carboxy-5-ureidoimidazoline decarboxylase [Bacteroidia bacterium]|jgi:2-oxo-4-hydroxy-4-carboxy-5-ureidoimidazoline decarboxylase|nr:2-oxo-4-hydroxy-4-carboxy-5-ureidoimidazoline decarboxylase [Bacteroidia bacterium]
MTIEELNNLPADKTFEELFKCCGSTTWAKQLTTKKPFDSKISLLHNSNWIWQNCTVRDALEAFTHHPKIGDLKSLEKKFASTKDWAGGEQAGVNVATQNTLIALADGNEAYYKKFGYIFIVCATGKTAEEMLALLNTRLGNTPDIEIKIAMGEQNKITHIRLEKLINE